MVQADHLPSGTVSYCSIFQKWKNRTFLLLYCIIYGLLNLFIGTFFSTHECTWLHPLPSFPQSTFTLLTSFFSWACLCTYTVQCSRTFPVGCAQVHTVHVQDHLSKQTQTQCSHCSSERSQLYLKQAQVPNVKLIHAIVWVFIFADQQPQVAVTSPVWHVSAGRKAECSTSGAPRSSSPTAAVHMRWWPTAGQTPPEWSAHV